MRPTRVIEHALTCRTLCAFAMLLVPLSSQCIGGVLLISHPRGISRQAIVNLGFYVNSLSQDGCYTWKVFLCLNISQFISDFLLCSPPTLAQNLHSTPPDLLGSAAPQIFTRSFEKRRESIVNGEVASSSTEKFHHNTDPTMPLNPPNESSKSSASLFTIKSRSPSDKPAFPQPETSEPIPYTQGDHQSSSSRKSKRGTSRHRQFLAELLQFYPHLSSAAGEANGISDDPSPTDSHAHRPSHSRSHSQPSRHSSHSISGILIMTTERLHTETARANAAEKQVAEVMSLFRNTHDQKSKSDRDLARAREELGWYKIQLDVAQKGW